MLYMRISEGSFREPATLNAERKQTLAYAYLVSGVHVLFNAYTQSSGGYYNFGCVVALLLSFFELNLNDSLENS